MKTVNIHLDTAELRDRVDPEQLMVTLGYLCTWGGAAVHRVEIYPEFRSETDFVAVFHREDDRMIIAIGAVWRADENRYTTHS